MKKTTYEKVLTHFNGVQNLARALTNYRTGEKGISKQAVYDWEGVVPMNRAHEIQILSDHQINAETIINVAKRKPR